MVLYITFFLSLLSIPSGGPQSHPLYSLLTPYQYSPTSLPPTYTAPSLVSTHNYLISLTFSLGPDEAATAWWLQKLVCDLNAISVLFQQSRRTLNMDTELVTYLSNYTIFQMATIWSCITLLNYALPPQERILYTCKD